jgi:hypothetical protein
VFAYVPSERVLQEGGYEARDAMVYFGFHGPFQPGLEDRIVEKVKELMQQFGRHCQQERSCHVSACSL